MKLIELNMLTFIVDPDEIRLLLSWYAEDVLRAVEMEVSGLEARIRLKYPEARYIELEPDGGKSMRATEALRYAIDIGSSASDAKKSEIEQLHTLQKYLTEEKLNNDLRSSLEYTQRTPTDERFDYDDDEAKTAEQRKKRTYHPPHKG